MRIALLIMFFTGLLLLIINQLIAGPRKEVKILYVQRDLDTYMREEPNALVTFNDMFTGDDVDPSDYKTS